MRILVADFRECRCANDTLLLLLMLIDILVTANINCCGTVTRVRRILQMLHDLIKGDGYVTLKRAAEENEMEIQWNNVTNLL